MSDHHILYRFFGDTGSLLYIGITNNPPSRFNQHRDSKDWWSEVCCITLEKYGSRTELALAERAAIRDEQPAYNIAHNNRPTSSVVTFVCDTCRRPVPDGTGYIHVSARDIDLARGGGPLAPWKVHCRRCDSASDAFDYWLDVEHASTHQKLLLRTARLLRSEWIRYTNLYEFITSLVPHPEGFFSEVDD